MAVRRGTGLQFGCFSIVRARDEGCLVLTIPLYVRHTNPKSSIRRGGKKKVLLISLEDKVHMKIGIFDKYSV